MTRVHVVDAAAREAQVIVPDYQLSLAIGKEGQNARLAARLTGWRIDIRSDAAVPADGPVVSPAVSSASAASSAASSAAWPDSPARSGTPTRRPRLPSSPDYPRSFVSFGRPGDQN